MDKKRFSDLEQKLNPSLRMKLDTIRKCLHEGKASCMVGAGFSKNAEMDDATRMKDWFELAEDFYESLYSSRPNPEDVKFKSVLRLASQVEASKGRAELESMIRNSLPDERINPGRLHVKLMRLPWSDVFTTNYDTLLEKAYIEADRYYYKVSNKETLLYTPHPRLVKLHGSFPDIRPFIITEEDFRTYPQRFPEFVNTVRQSLIENIMCLFGFSGDDPNFLSWLGWLRDVMGKQASPVYQITYNEKMHDSNVYLSHDIGIEIVNLAEIPTISGFSEALNFCLEYLEKEDKTSWRGNVDYQCLPHGKTLEKLDEMLLQMKKVRENYPGWVVLPSKYYSDFDDIAVRFPFMGSDFPLQNMDASKRIQFLYEINWRVETSLSPNNVEWFLLEIEQLPINMSGSITLEDYKKILVLKISLLDHYRVSEQDKEYDELLKALEQKKSLLPYGQQNRFVYIQCLKAISNLDYQKARELVAQWNLRAYDYVGFIRRSGVLIEIGQQREAETQLRELLKSIKRNILTSNYSELLSSAKGATEFLLWQMDPMESRSEMNNDFDYSNIVSGFRNQINEELDRPKSYRRTHGFNILETGYSWQMGPSGFKGDYLGAYRYFRLLESLGIPLSVINSVQIDKDIKSFMMGRLFPYEPLYVIRFMLRWSKEGVLESLSRGSLIYFSREQANAFFDSCIERCEEGLQHNSNSNQHYRVLTILVPVLCRMAVKLTQDRIRHIFDIVCRIYCDYESYFEPKVVNTLWKCLSGEDLKICQEKAFGLPIKGKTFPMSKSQLSGLEPSAEVISLTLDGLVSDDEKVADEAYKRLCLLYSCEISDFVRVDIINAMDMWREKNNDQAKGLLSLMQFPPKDKNVMQSAVEKELTSFLNKDFNQSKNTIADFSEALCRLQIGFGVFSEEQHVLFIQKVCQFLTENGDQMKFADSRDFFSRYSKNNQMFVCLREYTEIISESDLKFDLILESLREPLEKLRRKGAPVLTSLTHLSLLNVGNQASLKKHIFKILLSSNNEELIQDAGAALVAVVQRKGLRINQDLVKDIISHVSYVLDESTYLYLDIIKGILKYNGIKKEARQMLGQWFELLPKRLNTDCHSEEIKDDIRYYSNMIAGIMSVVWSEWPGLEQWQAYMNQDQINNDVRMGFEKGVSIVNG